MCQLDNYDPCSQHSCNGECWNCPYFITHKPSKT